MTPIFEETRNDVAKGHGLYGPSIQHAYYDGRGIVWERGPVHLVYSGYGMIVIRVELWPGGWPGNARELMRMHIINDGTASDGSGNSPRGNYRVALFRKGSQTKIFRTGAVKNYPRRSYHIGRLILRALASCFPEERRG